MAWLFHLVIYLLVLIQKTHNQQPRQVDISLENVIRDNFTMDPVLVIEYNHAE